MGNVIFGRCGERFGRRRGVSCGSFIAALARGAAVFRAAMMAKEERWIAVDDIAHEMGCWPTRGCCGPSVVQGVPGHAAVLPVEPGGCGGALG